MSDFDIIVVGAATAGSFFARKMAEKGYSVLVIDRLSQETLGKRLDIFHMARFEFDKYGLPLPKEGDKEWAFEFKHNVTLSPFDNYPKHTNNHVVGMHMPEYIALMNRWAEEVGAHFEYGASFEDFLYDANKKIAGITYVQEGETKAAYSKVVVDCSGITSAVRRKLPDNARVENFEISDMDKFYVILRYVKFKNEQDYLNGSGRAWPSFKTWEAPQTDPTGAIYGIGDCLSYDYAESVYQKFEKQIKLPEFDITHFERGTTPYRRPPYSFVADNFIVTGDAGCLTKPNNGEGVTSAMVQMVIAIDVLDEALKAGDCSEKALWPINVRYNATQGSEFCFTRAVLVSAVSAKDTEFEFFFKKNIIFSEKFLASADAGGVEMTMGDILKMACSILGGIITGKISIKTFKKLLHGISKGGALQKLYQNFPDAEHISEFPEWTKKAEELWSSVGSMGDNCK